MVGLKDWPQVQRPKTGKGRRLLYQVAAALAVFLLLLGLKEGGGPFGKQVSEGLRTVLTTEWNYQPVFERVVRHGLRTVNVDLPFFGEPAKPVQAPVSRQVLCLPVSGRMVRGFGWSEDPVDGLEKFHTGIDIAASPGTPVKAVADGEVVKTGTDPALGTYVLLDHGQGAATLYAQLDAVEVVLGQRVVAGEVLGCVGTKGDVAGGGLHFEYRENGRPVNPLHKIFLPGEGSER